MSSAPNSQDPAPVSRRSRIGVWVALGIAAILLIGVAVLFIVVLPALDDYTTHRTKVQEPFRMATQLSQYIGDFHARTGKMPTDLAALEYSSFTDMLARMEGNSIAYRNGRIELHIRTLEKPAAIFLTPDLPVAAASVLKWKCTSEDLRPGQLPPSCRE